MKTNQANLLNSLTLILMPLWAYLAFEGTIEKPNQSVTAFIPLFLGDTHMTLSSSALFAIGKIPKV